MGCTVRHETPSQNQTNNKAKLLLKILFSFFCVLLHDYSWWKFSYRPGWFWTHRPLLVEMPCPASILFTFIVTAMRNCGVHPQSYLFTFRVPMDFWDIQGVDDRFHAVKPQGSWLPFPLSVSRLQNIVVLSRVSNSVRDPISQNSRLA